MDNINTWTGLPVEESVKMTEDRDKWSKYVHSVASPGIEDGEKKNRMQIGSLRPNRPSRTAAILTRS